VPRLWSAAPARANKQEKETKATQIGKEKLEPFLFADMIL
jgi:hypothetical protein